MLRVLHVISGDDNGGAKVHLLSLIENNFLFDNTIACLGEGDLCKEANDKGIKTKLLTKTSIFKACKELIKITKSAEYDIINFHGARPNLIYMLIKSKLKNLKCCTTIHSDYRYDFIHSSKLKYLVFTKLNEISLKSFREFICVSKEIENVMKKLKYKGNFYVVNNGVKFNYTIKEDRETIRRRYNLENSFVYCMVARFHPVKNHENLIKAFYRLSREIESVKLLLVGEGNTKQEIKELVKSLNIEEKVKFTGNVSNPIDYINASDVNILVSKTETFPLVLLEGAIVKKAPVTTIVGDIKNIINNDSGYIIEGYDEENIYITLEKVYNDKSNLRVKAEKFYDVVKNNYSIECFWRKYLESYQKIKGGKL